MLTPKSSGIPVCFLALQIVCLPGAHAATVVAASCSQSDVQTAISAANDGDLVVVPAGSCTWVSGSENDASVEVNKSITLQGAGIDRTTITDGTGSGGKQVPVRISRPNARVTGFTFTGMRKTSSAEPGMLVARGARNFRVDNCRFDATGTSSPGRGIWTQDYGLIDHCIFEDTAQGVAAFGFGDASWEQPLSLGSANAVYVENCDFRYSEKRDGALDAYDGARYVFRFNTVSGTNIAHHGFDSGNYRSVHSFEVYGNTFDNPGTNIAHGFRSRGGTGVLFDNEFSTGYNSSLRVVYYRTCCDVSHSNCSGRGRCDGTNPLDGNEDPTGYPCMDQPGRTTGQVQAPMYEWDNFHEGVDADISVSDPWGCTDPSMSDHMKEGRDFINDTQMPGYTPFEYPHPLASGTTPPPPPPDSPPNPPTNLRVLGE